MPILTSSDKVLAFDPLSDATRKYRRATVGVASALLIVQSFDVSVEDIPAVGLRIEFPDELIPTVLMASLTYLIFHFVVHLTDDLINYPSSTFIKRQKDKWEAAADKAKAQFEIALVGSMKRHIDIREAENIAKEIGRWVTVVGDDSEKFFSERLQRELRYYSEEIPHSSLEDMSDNIMATYLSIRAEIALILRETPSLLPYWYFRNFRLYFLEAALPIAIAVLAFASVLSDDLTRYIQRLLG